MPQTDYTIMLGSAIFSDCGRYRYVLRRTWRADGRTVLIIGLNPSTADASNDDPTIRRCVRFAKDWGYGSLIVANLFAFRATQPAMLRTVRDPTGPRNDWWLTRLARQADLTVAAWGMHGSLIARDARVLRKLSDVYCLGLTKGGHPKHPLYLPASRTPVPFGLSVNN